MQSKNPVFVNNDSFNGRGATSAYTNPSTWQTGSSGYGDYQTPTTTDRGPMTIDSVVQKSVITLALVFAAAGVAWFWIGDLGDAGNTTGLAKAGTLATGGAIVGFALAMVNSFKKAISPPLVLAYAVVEGLFVGAFSKYISTFVGDPGIVFQAVLGTGVAFAGTLAAYKFFDIKVTDRFRRGFTAAMLGFVGLLVVNFVLSLFGAGLGLRNFSTLGLIISIVAVVFGVVSLIMDFDYVERGVAAGLPERESWRAAFGLTVTLVWLYIELLRILAILRGNN